MHLPGGSLSLKSPSLGRKFMLLWATPLHLLKRFPLVSANSVKPCFHWRKGMGTGRPPFSGPKSQKPGAISKQVPRGGKGGNKRAPALHPRVQGPLPPHAQPARTTLPKTDVPETWALRIPRRKRLRDRFGAVPGPAWLSEIVFDAPPPLCSNTPLGEPHAAGSFGTSVSKWKRASYTFFPEKAMVRVSAEGSSLLPHEETYPETNGFRGSDHR